MSLIINGTSVPSTKAIEYCPGGYLLGDTIEKVTCDGTTVWQLQKDINVLAVRDGWEIVRTAGNLAFSGNTLCSSIGSNSGPWVNYYQGTIDLTGYKKIQVSGNGNGDSAPGGGSTSMTAGVWVSQNGSRLITSVGVGVSAWAISGSDREIDFWAQGHTSESNPFGPTGTIVSGGKSNTSYNSYGGSFQFYVDVSGISGECLVQLLVRMYTSGPNASGSFYVTGLEFLS